MSAVESFAKGNERITEALDAIRARNAIFESAYESYVQEYGLSKISFNEAINIADTIDPVSLILGRNCVLSYLDSTKSLKGNLGSLELKWGDVCIIGRRNPQDSSLVGWTTTGAQMDLQEYNPRASTIPSRVHAAIIMEGEHRVLFSDLNSSSGTVVVGELAPSGPFVRVYDPGSPSRPTIRFERIMTKQRKVVV